MEYNHEQEIKEIVTSIDVMVKNYRFNSRELYDTYKSLLSFEKFKVREILSTKLADVLSSAFRETYYHPEHEFLIDISRSIFAEEYSNMVEEGVQVTKDKIKMMVDGILSNVVEHELRQHFAQYVRTKDLFPVKKIEFHLNFIPGADLS